MLEGKMEHQDSVGNKGVIGPGGVQWMTAGQVIVHSEMPKVTEGNLWGFQLWVNLPKRIRWWSLGVKITRQTISQWRGAVKTKSKSFSQHAFDPAGYAPFPVAPGMINAYPSLRPWGTPINPTPTSSTNPHAIPYAPAGPRPRQRTAAAMPPLAMHPPNTGFGHGMGYNTSFAAAWGPVVHPAYSRPAGAFRG